MYQIVRYTLARNECDAVTGTNAERLPMAYNSLALAQKLAAHMGRDEDEISFGVVHYGGSAYPRTIRPWAAVDLTSLPVPF